MDQRWGFQGYLTVTSEEALFRFRLSHHPPAKRGATLAANKSRLDIILYGSSLPFLSKA